MTAVLSGTLLFLAFLALPTRILIWVALIPWLLHVERRADEGAGPLELGRDGAGLFAVFWGLQLSWMLVLVARIRLVWPLTAYLGQVLLLSLLGAVFGAGLWALRRRRLPLPLAAAVAWVAVEWIRGHLLGPLRFPWSPVALPLVEWPALIQPAAWFGEAGPGFLVIVVNGLLVRAVRGTPGPSVSRWGWGDARGVLRFSMPPVLLAGVLLVTWWAVGVQRLQRAEVRPVVMAAAVQPALPLSVKRDSAAALEEGLARLSTLLPMLRDRSPEVVVLPETSFPVVFGDTAATEDPLPPPGAGSRDPTQGVERWLADWSMRLDAPILVGGYARGGGRENAVIQIDASGATARYGKVALVPGVEWIPGGGLARGGAPTPLPAPASPGALVCIESAWADLSRAQVREGAGWLVNVTNDAWLGDEEWWTRTPAFRQHPAHLVLRSVESGLGALRVANNGLTGVVSPLGRWRPLLAPHRPGVTTAEIGRLEGRTLFVRLGGWLGPVCALALALASVPLGAARR